VSDAPKPFPGPLNAIMIWLMGMFFVIGIDLMVAAWATPTAAMGIATALGLGGAGLLGAANIPPPHAERVGLRLPSARQLLGVLLLAPVVILASEVGNCIALFFPAPDAQQVVQETVQKLPVDTSLSILETLIVAVGLIPVVEEWFFRGVIQQGLVASLGAVWGVFVTALFFALGHGAGWSLQSWSVQLAQALLFGLAFGYARHRTGSLLSSILLHMGVNGSSVAAMAASAVIAIPGYNAPGKHTPLAILLASVASVGLGVWWLGRETVPAIPLVPAFDESDPFED
jgi:membrane protease YdiL (CAAX protease family)